MNGLFDAMSIPQMLSLFNQQQDFTPTRQQTMSPFNMGLLGMDPNMPNMIGPPSALPAEQQPIQSQLQMYGMEDQLNNPWMPQQISQPTAQAAGGGFGGYDVFGRPNFGSYLGTGGPYTDWVPYKQGSYAWQQAIDADQALQGGGGE